MLDNHRFSSEAGEALGPEGVAGAVVLAFHRPCHVRAEGAAPAAHDAPPVGSMPAAIPAFTHALDAEGKLSMFWFTPILERGAAFFARERHAEWSLSALPTLFCAHVLAAVGESITGREFIPQERRDFILRFWPAAEILGAAPKPSDALCRYVASMILANRPAPRRSFLNRLLCRENKS